MELETLLVASDILVFDTETTGVDPKEARVVEVGAVESRSLFGDMPKGWRWADGQKRIIRKRASFVNPGVPIPKESSDITGITDDQVASAESWATLGVRFMASCEAYPILVGYNALEYDVPLVNAENARHGIEARIDAAKTIDPVVFIRWHRRAERSRTLGEMCKVYEVALDGAHRASADAEATERLLWAMVREGTIPAELEPTMEMQAELKSKLDAEWKRFGYWFYVDRQDGTLRIGAGKHCGVKVGSVPASYFRFLAPKLEVGDAVTEETVSMFKDLAAGKRLVAS
jgi:DNA polymerase-3 subunit epsilon